MSAVVYDTIMSAIHNTICSGQAKLTVVYDTIMSAIHNCSVQSRQVG